MVSDRRKEQAAEQGANDIRQFWGEVDGEQMAALGDDYAALLDDAQERAPALLDQLFLNGDGVYAGGQGLDAILHDLAGRSISSNEINEILDAWRSSADSAWSKSGERIAVAEAQQAFETGV